MKHGFRKPSFSKSIAARTVGKAKRQLMRELIPGYGKKGMGKLHPIRSAYNQLYHQTTFGINDLNKIHSTQKTNTYCNSYNSAETKVMDSYARKVQNEIEKIRKKDDFDFFIYLNNLYKSINYVKEFETKYGFNHSRSDNLYNYLISNQDLFINEFLHRYYKKTVNKINSLKTNSAKFNNAYSFSYIINSNKQYLNKENLEIAEKYSSEIKNMVNYNF